MTVPNPPQLPPFPLDDGTLNVIRESLDRVVAGFDEDENAVYEGPEFCLDNVLNMLSGYDPSLLVQATNEYDQPIPDVYEYPHPIYHPNDLIRALIDEVQQLRAAVPAETCCGCGVMWNPGPQCVQPARGFAWMCRGCCPADHSGSCNCRAAGSGPGLQGETK